MEYKISLPDGVVCRVQVQTPAMNGACVVMPSLSSTAQRSG